MKTQSNFSSASSASERSAGSKPWASMPRLFKACSTPVPDMMETSRSAERPPYRTPTLPKLVMMSLTMLPLRSELLS
jgi:hypothetical protein